ncbi:MAG TPA: TonB-dependent receptor [Chitinophagaceae bacterium]|nr:TonB-dependent receptor [Chitinophagaceae bacterium]
MERSLLSLLLLLLTNFAFSQNHGLVSGMVTDKLTGEAIPGATVSVKGETYSVFTNSEGKFTLQKLSASRIVLNISHIGYEATELSVTVIERGVTTVDITLNRSERVGSEVVITASRRPEKITNAPASIQVIGIKELEQFPGSNVYELFSKVQGVEYTRNGVADITFNARGFHSAFNNKLLQLVDGRNSFASLSGGLPVMSRGSTMKDDIEKMEIALGPQSALYGPNAHNAVINVITRDARKYPGTTLSISAGSRYQFSGRIRQAEKISNKWAYKLTGEYATGKEYTFYNRVYLNNADTIGIPEHNVDFNFRNIRGEANLYYSLTPKTDIILSGGTSTNDWIQVTTGGRNQMRGYAYSFVQARVVHPRFFITVYNTWGSIGTSYPIEAYTTAFWNLTHRQPNPVSPDSAEVIALRGVQFKEKGQRTNAEAQYNYTFKQAKLFLVAGLNFQQERPNGYGINLVDSFEKINVIQYGAVVQFDKSLPWNMRFISTVRFDRHDNFGNFFSPRFALVKNIDEGSFRITWGRAIAMPSILNQYAGINRLLFGNGAGIKYIRNNAKFSDPASISYTNPLKPEQVNTWELGYKGAITRRLYVDINYYNGASKNFISPARTVQGRVLTVNGISVTHNPAFAGSISNDTLRGASFLTFFNYAAVREYGLDAGLNYKFSRFVNVWVRYSWFGSTITKRDMKNDADRDQYISLEETSLNAPGNRGMVLLDFQNLCKEKLSVSLTTRYVQKYDFYSGSQIGTAAGKGSRGKVYVESGGQPRWAMKNFDYGPLGGFTTVDLSAGYKVNQMVTVNMGVVNLFNVDQIEFVGSPSIGRLLMCEIKINVPNTKTAK